MTDAAMNLPALQDYLAEQGVALQGELTAELIAGGKSNLTYAISDGANKWVLRRPPVSGLTPSAHDMAREFRVVSGLRGSGVPVADAIVLCEDNSVLGAPFAMVEFVEGQVIRNESELARYSDADLTRCTDELVRVLAALHNVDYQAAGLGEFGRPDGYLTRQVGLWAKQWGRVKDGELAANDSDVERLHRALETMIPTQAAATIVHGDYRIDNTILDADDVGQVRAVVDWELSTLGDPLTDVAMMCVYRDPALELVLGEPAAWTSSRLASADELAQQYSTASGRELANWGFYLGLANFKLAVIAAGIDHRYRSGATVGDGFDKAIDAVPIFLAAGLRAVKEQS
ncbi:phosphotransferase family protein [Tomitella biformata]|uniref:phosphotransferase family protein n=1 Tax=Tomitella biformata TaxID=630403 RepID=UPI000463769D|nr:phosphotransferase family protein [Tomitella biformata]